MFRLRQIPALQHGRFSATLKSSGNYWGLRCNGESWFKIALPDGGSISAKISFRNSEGDLDLYLFDQAGIQLASSESTSDTEQVTMNSLHPGYYYLKVMGYNGAHATYALSLVTGGVVTPHLSAPLKRR